MLATNLETRYMVREAVLSRTWSGHAWRVRFAPVTSDAEEEVVVLISPQGHRPDDLRDPYTLGEIEDFADRHQP
jgi:hypothetical protein